MAHQDFSQICPIFKEGVEKEITIPIRATATVSTTFGNLPMGREVEFIECMAVYATGSLSTTAGCVIGLFKNTLSTQFGSINITQSSFGVGATTDCIPNTVVGSCTSSVAFTSTDLLCIALTTKGAGAAYKIDVLCRYRDK